MKYRVTFTESVVVEADTDQEAKSVAEETIYYGLGGLPVTEDVEIEPVTA